MNGNYCTNCGTYNPTGSKFCGNCGEPLTTGNANVKTEQIITTKNTKASKDKPIYFIATFFLSLVFPPIGLIMLLRSKKMERANKTTKIIIILLFTMLFLMWCLARCAPTIPTDEINDNSINNNNEVIEQDDNEIKDTLENEAIFTESELTNTSFVALDNSMIKRLMEVGFTNEEACEIQGILNSVGVNTISKLERGAGEGIDKLQSFACYANGNPDLRFFFTVENRELFYAGFAGEDLYDTAYGGVLKQIQDVDIPEREISTAMQIELMDCAKSAIKNHLNYPSTTNFKAGSWVFSRWNNEFNVYVEFTAQNGFGVPKDAACNLKIVHSDGLYIVTGMDMIY